MLAVRQICYAGKFNYYRARLCPDFPVLNSFDPCVFRRGQVSIGDRRAMASAYIGVLLLPPIFGFIANAISIQLLPLYLLLMFAIMAYAYRNLVRETSLSLIFLLNEEESVPLPRVERGRQANNLALSPYGTNVYI